MPTCCKHCAPNSKRSTPIFAFARSAKRNSQRATPQRKRKRRSSRRWQSRRSAPQTFNNLQSVCAPKMRRSRRRWPQTRQRRRPLLRRRQRRSRASKQRLHSADRRSLRLERSASCRLDAQTSKRNSRIKTAKSPYLERKTRYVRMRGVSERMQAPAV